MVSPRETRPLVPIFEPCLPEVRIGEIRVLSLVMKYFGAGDVDMGLSLTPSSRSGRSRGSKAIYQFPLLINEVGIGKDSVVCSLEAATRSRYRTSLRCGSAFAGRSSSLASFAGSLGLGSSSSSISPSIVGLVVRIDSERHRFPSRFFGILVS